MVMTSTKFIEKLKEIASLPTTYYSVSGGAWAKWNGNSWNFDCVILIKAILWGWNGNKNHAHGGANYGSNGVYDDNTEGLIARCDNVSSDFSNITPGEVLWMQGHVGVYIGNGQVIECTAGWESKVLYSQVDSQGRRTRNGSQIYSWKKHGKLPYIEYVSTTPSTSSTNNNYKIGDVVTINGVYVSSTSTQKLNPAKTKGTITRIVSDAENPYLLDNGNIGWVNDSCIVSNSKKSIDEVARLVIRGDYGNQPDRQKKLEVEGYNYREVQNRVNELL